MRDVDRQQVANPWTRRRRSVVPVVGAVLASVLIGSGPADARTRAFTDPKDDAPYAHDIRKVRVSVTKKHVKVRIRLNDFPISGEFSSLAIFFDTKRARRGPEFAVYAGPDTDYTIRRTTRSWKAKRPSSCGGSRMRYSVFEPRRVTISIPRRCLGNPRKVRVAVKTREQYATRVFSDWAPKRRAFYPWVRR